MKKKIVLIPMLMAFVMIGVSSPSLSEAKSSRYNTPKLIEKRCTWVDRFQDRLFNRFDQDNRLILGWLQRVIKYENRIPCEPKENVVETLVGNDNFSTLVAAVGATGLVDALDGPDAVTVFAPTNQAFEKLPDGTVEALLGDVPTLTSILTYHVLDGAVPAEVALTLDGQSVPTINGDSIDISIDNGKLFIDESQVILYDIKTTNGVIHVIDTVLIP